MIGKNDEQKKMNKLKKGKKKKLLTMQWNVLCAAGRRVR